MIRGMQTNSNFVTVRIRFINFYLEFGSLFVCSGFSLISYIVYVKLMGSELFKNGYYDVRCILSKFITL